MGVSYKYASSFLLCPEDSNSVLGLGEEKQDFHREPPKRNLCRSPDERFDFYGKMWRDFSLPSEECIALLIERESQHLLPGDYAERLLGGQLDLALRSDAIDWIQKVHAHYNFGPLSAYLSINYLDRFFSSYEFSIDKAWMTQLLSVACLSLAAKAEEMEVPSSLDLQVGEAKYIFEARTIQRMELLVLSTLNWRMHVVTPFSFIDYFLYKLNDGKCPDSSIVSSSVDLIMSTVKGIDFLGFKPSEIAAAVALSALEAYHTLDIDNTLACWIHVDNEKVLRCHGVIQEMNLMKNKAYNNKTPSVSAVPKSPAGVLDVACVSYKSDDTTVSSLGNHSHATSSTAKKMKLNRSISS
ncbi:cyclin-D3-1-like [Curcuma longa]|uniref:cyclin-D3-1-like n=1 Tax=Curcuma longa TaxID=136217 RepID=UPI003D9EB262